MITMKNNNVSVPKMKREQVNDKNKLKYKHED